MVRLLMRFAPRGVRPAEIEAAALGLRPSTLSHHLNDLSMALQARVDRIGFLNDLAHPG